MPNFHILFIVGHHSLWYFVVPFLLQAASARQLKAVKSADIMLSGLFPIHKSANSGSCNLLFKEGVVLSEAMAFAVNFVNKNKMLPHEITFGYDIRDTCNDVITALETSLDFVNERKVKDSKRSSNFSSSLRKSSVSSKNPIAVIGAGNSIISSAVNNILSIFKVPQIGYASTSRILSDKNRYPTFLRTVPPDSHQGRAIAKIVSYFQWNYVALLASDDIYGRPLAETFKVEAKKFGICLALDILIPYNPSKIELQKTVHKIRNDKNIDIILLFTAEKEAAAILDEAMLQNVTKKLWIASDSWADSPKIAEDHANVVDGMLRVINHPTIVPDFMKYFYTFSLSANKHNPWFGEFWEETFRCSVLDINSKFPTGDKLDKTLKLTECSGKEQLSDQLIQTDAVFSRVSFVLDAVMSVVYSIRKICPIELNITMATTSEELSRKEACIQRVTPSNVLTQIFNVAFTNFANRTIFFDKNGDGIGRYDVINLQKHTENRSRTSFLKIGEYDGKNGLLRLNSHAIHWPGGVTFPPNGRCSLKCPPGTYKVVLKPICCWLCKPCPSGSISDASGVSSCIQCQSGKVANDNKTNCVSVPMTFLRWHSAWAWVLITTTCVCETLCFVTIVIFLRYKETPVVKAANREISFLLLFGLLVGFLVPLAYIGRPTDRGCKIQVILFGSSFSFSLSIILARINRTIVVFRYSKVTLKGKSKFFKKYLSLFLYNRTQIMLALFLTVTELLLCAAWLLSSPPRVTARRLTINTSLLMCKASTSFGHIIANAFITFLSLLCTFVAFKSRKLPQNYNEAKFISFALFVFNFIWLTFVSVFYGTPDGQHNVIINCFAIQASNFVILALIFWPKLYIILFRPDLNQMTVFRALTAQYTFKTSRRSSAITSDIMGSSCIMKESKYVQTSGVWTVEQPENSNGTWTAVEDIQGKNTTIARRNKISKDIVKISNNIRAGSLESKAASDSALNRRSLFHYSRDSSHWYSNEERRGSTIEAGTCRSVIGNESIRNSLREKLRQNGQAKYPPITRSNCFPPSSTKITNSRLSHHRIKYETVKVMESYV